MTLSTEQLEELERLLKQIRDIASGWSMQTPNRDFQRIKQFASEALPLIAAAANRSTAGFGAEGVDQRGDCRPDFDAADHKKVASIMLRYGTFGDDQEAARRQANCCASEVLAALTPLAAAPKAPTTPLRETVERIVYGWVHKEHGGRIDYFSVERLAEELITRITTPDLAVKELVEAARVLRTRLNTWAASALLAREKVLNEDVQKENLRAVLTDAVEFVDRALATLGGDQ